jgi:hypothetical protein
MLNMIATRVHFMMAMLLASAVAAPLEAAVEMPADGCETYAELLTAIAERSPVPFLALAPADINHPLPAPPEGRTIGELTHWLDEEAKAYELWRDGDDRYLAAVWLPLEPEWIPPRVFGWFPDDERTGIALRALIADLDHRQCALVAVAEGVPTSDMDGALQEAVARLFGKDPADPAVRAALSYAGTRLTLKLQPTVILQTEPVRKGEEVFALGAFLRKDSARVHYLGRQQEKLVPVGPPPGLEQAVELYDGYLARHTPLESPARGAAPLEIRPDAVVEFNDSVVSVASLVDALSEAAGVPIEVPAELADRQMVISPGGWSVPVLLDALSASTRMCWREGEGALALELPGPGALPTPLAAQLDLADGWRTTLFNAGSPQVGELVEVSSLDPAQREWIAAELRERDPSAAMPADSRAVVNVSVDLTLEVWAPLEEPADAGQQRCVKVDEWYWLTAWFWDRMGGLQR